MANQKRNPWVPHDKFVMAWQASKSVSEAAKSLGVENKAASIQAAYLRSKGVPLRKFTSPGRPAQDYGALATLARKAIRAA